MKPRLFCFGDSFVDWDIPKHHWTYYLTYHYEVYNYGKRGADNYSILFQLGHLPEYLEGDRVVVMFTEPGRFPRRFYEGNDLNEKLNHIKYTEAKRWDSGKRNIEVQFLKNLLIWMENYSPVFLTWNEYFYKLTSDFVTLIEVSSNSQENITSKPDFHPGPVGCYNIYIKLHSLLDVKEPIIDSKSE